VSNWVGRRFRFSKMLPDASLPLLQHRTIFHHWNLRPSNICLLPYAHSAVLKPMPPPNKECSPLTTYVTGCGRDRWRKRRTRK